MIQYIVENRLYVMWSRFRDHQSYPIRREVMVKNVTYVHGPDGTVLQGESRVWFRCLNDEHRFLPLNEFLSQYFDGTNCDYTSIRQDW